MSFDSSAARDFPYTFKNLDFNVQAKTSVSKLLNFDDFPDVDFDVKSLDTELDGLPDIENLSGKLSTSEDPFSFNIKFNDLTINTTGGKLILNGLYNGAENLPLYLKTNLITKNLNLRDYLMQFEMDVDTSSLFNAVLNSSMYAEIQFPREDFVFETFTLKNCDINYIIQPDQDTVSIESMTMDFSNVVYDLNQNPNPLATLSTTGKIDFGKISSSEFVLENPAYDISVINGKYKIIPLRSSIFGKRGEGTFEFEPWAEMPEYKIAYSVKQFEIENFLTTFMEESVLTGKMDLSLSISMKGGDWENMVSRLDGEISLTGSNLTLHGLDVDRLLERVARSQNFNLLDVSAVILAGPVGLAITKGTDIASIVMLSPGEKTTIPQLVSIWTMHNGNLDMTDIAFTTKQHRIASKGYINLAQKNLDVTIAEVNKKGCIILSQKVSGNLEDPKTGNIKVLESLLSPVTNLFNSIIGKDCEVFYDGSVRHPK
jgi:AsmA protein